jgi:hypothetical protein
MDYYETNAKTFHYETIFLFHQRIALLLAVLFVVAI